jgi:hypothetical protein
MVQEELGFTDAEWGLLVGLPQSVMLAASAIEDDGSRRTNTENAAGLTAIADGRQSASPLVYAIANEIAERVGDPEEDEELPGQPIPDLPTPPEPDEYAKDVLDRARSAAALLKERSDEGEAGAYKHWLVTIADEVVNAVSTGSVLGIGGTQVSDAERSFRDDLSSVLND